MVNSAEFDSKRKVIVKFMLCYLLSYVMVCPFSSQIFLLYGKDINANFQDLGEN